MVAASRRKWGLRLRPGTKRWVAALLVLLLAGSVQGAFDYPGGSMRSFAQAGATNLWNPSPHDVATNPALAPLRQLVFAADWSRLYRMADFDLSSAGASYTTSGLTASLTVRQLSGSGYYWERQYTLALSQGVHRSLHWGGSLRYLRIEFGEGYRSLSTLVFDMGALIDIASDMRVGVSGQNLTGARLDAAVERMPREATLALTWLISKELALSLSHQISESLPDRFAAGQELHVCDEFSLLLGVSNNPTDFAGGFSLRLGGIEFEYAYRNSVYLGGTHRIGVQYAR